MLLRIVLSSLCSQRYIISQTANELLFYMFMSKRDEQLCLCGLIRDLGVFHDVMSLIALQEDIFVYTS